MNGRETDIWNCVLEHAYEDLYRDYPLDPEISKPVDQTFDGVPSKRERGNSGGMICYGTNLRETA